MSRVRRPFTVMFTLATGVALITSACGDDVETQPIPTTGTPSGSAGSGATSTGTTTGGGGTGGNVGGGGTGGTAGSGGQVPLSGEDLCPGDPYAFTAGDSYHLYGDTDQANDDYASGCTGGSGSGPDLVYQLDVQERGTVKITLTREAPSTLDPALYLRREMMGGAGGHDPNDVCSLEDYTWWCSSYGDNQERMWFHTEPDLFYLHVDGVSGSSGFYTLDMEVTEPVCGDCVTNLAPPGGTGGGGGGGIVGEDCDDCNADPDDGCHQCQYVLVSANDTCPGEALDLAEGSWVFQGSTVPYQPDVAYVAQSPGCDFASTDLGKDRLFDVVPEVSGTLTVAIGWDVAHIIDVCQGFGPNDPGCWDRALYAYGPSQADCGQTQVACSDDVVDWMAIEEISFAVTAGSHYSIAVDSWYHDPQFPDFYSGTFNIHLDLVAN